jgi:hypothetical protein
MPSFSERGSVMDARPCALDYSSTNTAPVFCVSQFIIACGTARVRPASLLSPHSTRRTWPL